MGGCMMLGFHAHVLAEQLRTFDNLTGLDVKLR